MLVHKTCFVKIHQMNFPLIVQSQSYKIHTQCELDFPDIYLHQTLHKNRLIFGVLWTFTNTHKATNSNYFVKNTFENTYAQKTCKITLIK